VLFLSPVVRLDHRIGGEERRQFGFGIGRALHAGRDLLEGRALLGLSTEWHLVQPLYFIAFVAASASAAALSVIEKAYIAAAARRETGFIDYP
jgi:hypothetical protein